MELVIFDKVTRNRVSLIKTYTFAQYKKEFTGDGEFEIRIPVVEESLPYLVADNYIMFDKETFGIIKHISSVFDDETELKVTGKMATTILSYRSFLTTKKLTNISVTNVIISCFIELFYMPKDRKRKIDFLYHRVDTIDKKITWQNTGDTFLEALKNLALAHDFGFNLTPELSKNENESNLRMLILDIIKPVDRTVGNKDGNVPIVFSFELDNLTRYEFEDDSSKYCSVAVVAAEGIGEERHVIEVGDTDKSGIDRIELYVDARDLQPEENEEELTEEQKIKINQELEDKMYERGIEKLSEVKRFVSFDGTINTNSMKYEFGKDFKLGDKVTVISKELNKKINTQIISVTKSTSEGIDYLDIEFGYSRLSLLK